MVERERVEGPATAAVVFAPDVLAQLHAKAKGPPVPEPHPVRIQPVLQRPALCFGEVAQREEVPVVVEESVVGMQGFGVDAAGQPGGHGVAHHVRAVGAHIDGVVLAPPAILALVDGVYRHVAKDHGQPRAGLANLVAVRGKVLDVSVYLPQVAEDIAADAQLGKDHDLRARRPRLLDKGQHPLRVQVGSPGLDR